jgi:hypothetical protein
MDWGKGLTDVRDGCGTTGKNEYNLNGKFWFEPCWTHKWCGIACGWPCGSWGPCLSLKSLISVTDHWTYTHLGGWFGGKGAVLARMNTTWMESLVWTTGMLNSQLVHGILTTNREIINIRDKTLNLKNTHNVNIFEWGCWFRPGPLACLCAKSLISVIDHWTYTIYSRWQIMLKSIRARREIIIWTRIRGPG